MLLKFEKATENDISAIVGIYDDILKKEQDGLGVPDGYKIFTRQKVRRIAPLKTASFTSAVTKVQ